VSQPAKNDFKWRRYQGQLILLSVRWYLTYTLSYRQLERMLREQGWSVDHTSVFRWVQRYGPELAQRCRAFLKPTNRSYRVDETFHEMPGHCQAVFSCAVTKLVRLRRSLSSLVASYSLLRLSG
jgi:transposase-like protein